MVAVREIRRHAARAVDGIDDHDEKDGERDEEHLARQPEAEPDDRQRHPRDARHRTNRFDDRQEHVA